MKQQGSTTFCYSIEDQAKKYLSDKIKSLQPVNEVIEDNRPAARPDLHQACIMKSTAGGEPTEEELKEFCESLNKLAEEGVIEYGVLGPLVFCKLNSFIHQNSRLIFTTFSKLPLEDQKEHSHLFKKEGESF